MEPDPCLWETTYLYDEWALSTCPEKKSKLTSHFQRRLLGPMHLRLEITYVYSCLHKLPNWKFKVFKSRIFNLKESLQHMFTNQSK